MNNPPIIIDSELDSNDLPSDVIRKIIAQMLIDSIPGLVNEISNATTLAIKPIISDYIIEFRRKLVKGIEFKLPKNAAKLAGISLNTLYTYIANGMIKIYSIENTNYVSMTELNEYVKAHKYHKYSNVKAKSKSLGSIEDS